MLMEKDDKFPVLMYVLDCRMLKIDLVVNVLDHELEGFLTQHDEQI